MNINDLPSIYPYIGVSADETRTVGGHSLRFIIHGAYNALGLIGSEYNGIAIFDNDYMKVVLDKHCPIGSGYYGPSVEQVEEFNRLLSLEWADLATFINSHSRSRLHYPVLDESPVIRGEDNETNS